MVITGIYYALGLIAGGLAAGYLIKPAWGIPFYLLAAFCLNFFRDPDRVIPPGRVAVSPADGKIVSIKEMSPSETRVSIFMNVFDVHVNRYPVAGTVRYVHRAEGKFLNAAAEAASLENEQVTVGIESGNYRVLVRQIAGLIARRIVTYSREGERVEQGERMGIIRFGSRVDLMLPLRSTVLVRVGQRTVAGVTVVATLPPE